jgi:hypothetical protein
MIGSRRAAITASLIGALLIAGAPTFAFGEGDATHQAKAQSAATSSDMSAQKAKDEGDKGGDKQASDKKDSNKGGDKQASDKKESNKGGDKQGSDKKPSDKKDNNRGDDKQASDWKRHDNGNNDGGKKDDRWNNGGNKDDRWNNGGNKDDRKNDGGWKNDHQNGDWKDKNHDDNWDRNWDHNYDRDHHRHDWDTHRRYYRYGYYGPGYYDDCGYYGSGYDGSRSDYSYYGPDACGYQYGGYRSHFLVDMSWDQEVPRPGPRGAVGTANLDIDVPAGRVCFRLAYDGIERAIGAQIHPGRLGEGGPNLVLLHVGENGDDGCVGADPQILSEIQNDPRGYYLEIDDQNGPAMRGQLDAPDYRNRY